MFYVWRHENDAVYQQRLAEVEHLHPREVEIAQLGGDVQFDPELAARRVIIQVPEDY